MASKAALPLPDGRTLLATAAGRKVRLWDPLSRQPVEDVATGHTRPVTAVLAMPLPDGRTLLATGSHDNTVRLWDSTGTDKLIIQVGAAINDLALIRPVRLAVGMADGLTVISLCEPWLTATEADRHEPRW